MTSRLERLEALDRLKKIDYSHGNRHPHPLWRYHHHTFPVTEGPRCHHRQCADLGEHVSNTMRRCYSVLIGLSRMRHRMPRQTRQLLVEALIFPLIRYCMSVWGGCTVTQQRRLRKCINFGARIVVNLKRHDRATASLRELG